MTTSHSDRPKAIGALIIAAFFFGSTFLFVKNAVELAEPVPFIAVRFAIGSVAVGLVLRLQRRSRPPLLELVRHGAVPGFALGSAYLLQTIGLQYTSGSVSAFITYLLVVFVPLLSFLFTRRRPGPLVGAGIVVSFLGLALVSGADGVGFGRGQALTLGCAVLFAAHIFLLSHSAGRIDPMWSAGAQLVTVALLAAVLTLFTDGSAGFSFPAAAFRAAVYLGIVASALAFFLQTWAQDHLDATRTALLLMLEPVFAAILGYLVDHDRLGTRGALGAILILVGITIAELAPKGAGPRSHA